MSDPSDPSDDSGLRLRATEVILAMDEPTWRQHVIDQLAYASNRRHYMHGDVLSYISKEGLNREDLAELVHENAEAVKDLLRIWRGDDSNGEKGAVHRLRDAERMVTELYKWHDLQGLLAKQSTTRWDRWLPAIIGIAALALSAYFGATS